MQGDADYAFLAGGGEMGERTRTADWSQTPVGPPSQWPQSLKTAVSICLASRHPMVVWWGRPAYTQFYNDAYIPFLGEGKHPHWLGRSGRECWSEIWSTIGPMLDGVFTTGQATWSEDLLLVLDRALPREETYFTFSYGPIRGDDGAIGGIFCACNETTARVVGERRLRTLRDLGHTHELQTAEGVCEFAGRILGENPADLPFALIYLLDEDGGAARLAAATGLHAGDPAAPATLVLGDGADPGATWDVAGVLRNGIAELVHDAGARFGALPGGPWPEPADIAAIVPILPPGRNGIGGFLIAGFSPRCVVDAEYRGFFDMVAAQIGTSIANARGHEEARRRAEALAEIDRAKTAFFSNVSHEFRTPLTLMMGPLEDTLAQSQALPAAARERLELAHRNALRLLKLVNTLLDFSRIEAGRLQAAYEPVELAGYTADLASVFRAAIERAGMTLRIDCPPLPQRVYVDRGMWEKIVLNLLSNAFKFTFEGEIEVALHQADGRVALSVRDTGTGIAAEEVPRLFERFHRVRGARGRSYEGSGIGLALVQELVRLHGGTIAVDSKVGHGSRFVVAVPLGTAHLPADRIEAERDDTSAASQAEAYAQEAMRWLPEDRQETRTAEQWSDRPVEDAGADGVDGVSLPAVAAPGGHILLADDNADMRDYLQRLLTERGYRVRAVADGAAALRAAGEDKPDLVLSDVMMPGLDGFALLQRLRGDPELREIPVIVLSARAGEEARIEGLDAGADDYLIKPFSARELLARVASQLNMMRFRHAAAEALRFRTAQFETLLNQAPLGVYLVDADFCIRHANPTARAAFGDIAGGVIGGDFGEIARRLWGRKHADEKARIFRRTLATGEPHIVAAEAAFRIDHATTEHHEWRVDRIALPDGRFGLVCYFRDIAHQVQAERTRQLLVDELNHRIKNTLASVQAIAQQTLRTARTPQDFAAGFSGRIQALASVHSLLTDTNWRGAELAELIRDQMLLAAADETRFAARGPAIRLEAQTTLHVALMLHELCTNSVKYGALSAVRGSIAIDWSVRKDVLTLCWAERGGPRVVAPVSRGFGTTLIEQSAHSEGGAATMTCGAEGVSWEIVLPLSPVAAALAEGESRAGETSPGAGLPEAAEPGPRLDGLRFLVVEDEPLVALVLIDSLEEAGAEVVSVGTEAEAIETIARSRFDRALLDANLHGQPADAIAAALTRRGIPFLFVTGYGRATLPAAFAHAPVLGKPFRRRQLLEAIEALTSRSAGVVPLRV